MNIKTNNDKIMITLKTKTAVDLRFPILYRFEYSIFLICDYSAR